MNLPTIWMVYVYEISGLVIVYISLKDYVKATHHLFDI